MLPKFLTVIYLTTDWKKRKVENNYFYNALHNFAFEEAGGGAIRHLADSGYTAKQIAETLSFPLPYEEVRKAFTAHLLEKGILLKEKPETHIRQEKTEYVREYDKYGKPSFRRVKASEEPAAEAEKKQYIACNFGAEGAESLLDALDKRQREYIEGICWTRRTMYHLLDERMTGIMKRLSENGLPVGEIIMLS